MNKVMEWLDGTSWRVTTAFAASVNNVAWNNNFSQAIKDIEDNKTGVTLSEEDVKRIEALAAIATAIDSNAIEAGTQPFTVAANGDFTYRDVTSPAAPGLYLAIVAARNAGTLYNPMVLASDYSQTDGTNTIDSESDNMIRGE